MKIRSGMSISLCKSDKVLHLSLFFLAACQVTVNALWLIISYLISCFNDVK